MTMKWGSALQTDNFIPATLMSNYAKSETEIETELKPVFSNENIELPHKVLSYVKSFDGQGVQITSDVDEAMKFALDAEEVTLSDQDAKKLLRKIDFFLLPLICLLYACQFMDKVSNGYAAIMGLRQYFDMVSNQYSWTGSAFYLSYLIFEFPVATVLQRFPVAKTTATFIVLWGMIVCLHSVPSTYAGFLTLRVLLGLFESAVTPAMVIITGQWYRKEEQFFRTSIWFACNGLGTILGSGIAYGLATHAESYSLPAWKVLYIVIGCMTIFVGFLIGIWIPDVPARAWWLTEREKKQTVLRIKTNQQGFGNKHFKFHQFKEAIFDINTWLFFFLALATDIPNGALTNFGSILLNTTFDYSSTKSLLMNMPGGAVELVGCTFLAYSSRWLKHRLFAALISVVISLIAVCLLAFAEQSAHARLAGYYLSNVLAVQMICCLSCFSSNIAGHTKKITVNALYLIGYCVGNLIGPQTFVAAQAPEYVGGETAMVVCLAVAFFLLAALYYNFWRENKRRDCLAADGLLETPFIENIEFADLTDKENPFFRYQL